jgi:hypothetical protein
VTDSTECRRILGALRAFGPVLSIKSYRITLENPPAIPLLPCLDHEAMLHGGIAPHMAVYIQEAASGNLHELVFVPGKRRVDVDIVSTWGESSPESHTRVLQMLAHVFPEYAVKISGPSWWRGDRRVAQACAAQVTLRDVLLSDDVATVKTRIDRLQTVSSLMEKESRVASWGARTVTGPLLAAAGVVTFYVLGGFAVYLGETGVTALRSLLVGLLGAGFLYYGLKAVQLTEMGNRVWKRSAEYNLILQERQRLAREWRSEREMGNSEIRSPDIKSSNR